MPTALSSEADGASAVGERADGRERKGDRRREEVELRELGGGDGVGIDPRYHRLDCQHATSGQQAPLWALQLRDGIQPAGCCHDIGP